MTNVALGPDPCCNSNVWRASVLQFRTLQSILLTCTVVIQKLSIAQETEYVKGPILADSDVNDGGEPWSKASWQGPAVEPIWVASG